MCSLPYLRTEMSSSSKLTYASVLTNKKTDEQCSSKCGSPNKSRTHQMAINNSGPGVASTSGFSSAATSSAATQSASDAETENLSIKNQPKMSESFEKGLHDTLNKNASDVSHNSGKPDTSGRHSTADKYRRDNDISPDADEWCKLPPCKTKHTCDPQANLNASWAKPCSVLGRAASNTVSVVAPNNYFVSDEKVKKEIVDRGNFVKIGSCGGGNNASHVGDRSGTDSMSRQPNHTLQGRRSINSNSSATPGSSSSNTSSLKATSGILSSSIDAVIKLLSGSFNSSSSRHVNDDDKRSSRQTVNPISNSELESFNAMDAYRISEMQQRRRGVSSETIELADDEADDLNGDHIPPVFTGYNGSHVIESSRFPNIYCQDRLREDEWIESLCQMVQSQPGWHCFYVPKYESDHKPFCIEPRNVLYLLPPNYTPESTLDFAALYINDHFSFPDEWRYEIKPKLRASNDQLPPQLPPRPKRAGSDEETDHGGYAAPGVTRRFSKRLQKKADLNDRQNDQLDCDKMEVDESIDFSGDRNQATGVNAGACNNSNANEQLLQCKMESECAKLSRASSSSSIEILDAPNITKCSPDSSTYKQCKTSSSQLNNVCGAELHAINNADPASHQLVKLLDDAINTTALFSNCAKEPNADDAAAQSLEQLKQNFKDLTTFNSRPVTDKAASSVSALESGSLPACLDFRSYPSWVPPASIFFPSGFVTRTLDEHKPPQHPGGVSSPLHISVNGHANGDTIQNASGGYSQNFVNGRYVYADSPAALRANAGGRVCTLSHFPPMSLSGCSLMHSTPNDCRVSASEIENFSPKTVHVNGVNGEISGIGRGRGAGYPAPKPNVGPSRGEDILRSLQDLVHELSIRDFQEKNGGGFRKPCYNLRANEACSSSQPPPSSSSYTAASAPPSGESMDTDDISFIDPAVTNVVRSRSAAAGKREEEEEILEIVSDGDAETPRPERKNAVHVGDLQQKKNILTGNTSQSSSASTSTSVLSLPETVSIDTDEDADGDDTRIVAERQNIEPARGAKFACVKAPANYDYVPPILEYDPAVTDWRKIRESRRFYCIPASLTNIAMTVVRNDKESDLHKRYSVALEMWIREVNKSVDIFNLDGLFLPFCIDQHYILLVVVNPGFFKKSFCLEGGVALHKAAAENNGFVRKCDFEPFYKEFPLEPCFIYLDSMHSLLTDARKRDALRCAIEVLDVAWSQQGNITEYSAIQWHPPNETILPVFACEPPQQVDSFNCGLFVIYFVERLMVKFFDRLISYKPWRSCEYDVRNQVRGLLEPHTAEQLKFLRTLWLRRIFHTRTICSLDHVHALNMPVIDELWLEPAHQPSASSKTWDPLSLNEYFRTLSESSYAQKWEAKQPKKNNAGGGDEVDGRKKVPKGGEIVVPSVGDPKAGTSEKTKNDGGCGKRKNNHRLDTQV